MGVTPGPLVLILNTLEPSGPINKELVDGDSDPQRIRLMRVPADSVSTTT
jgi:hypothetical protein